MLPLLSQSQSFKMRLSRLKALRYSSCGLETSFHVIHLTHANILENSSSHNPYGNACIRKRAVAWDLDDQVLVLIRNLRKRCWILRTFESLPGNKGLAQMPDLSKLAAKALPALILRQGMAFIITSWAAVPRTASRDCLHLHSVWTSYPGQGGLGLKVPAAVKLLSSGRDVLFAWLHHHGFGSSNLAYFSPEPLQTLFFLSGVFFVATLHFCFTSPSHM